MKKMLTLLTMTLTIPLFMNVSWVTEESLKDDGQKIKKSRKQNSTGCFSCFGKKKRNDSLVMEISEVRSLAIVTKGTNKNDLEKVFIDAKNSPVEGAEFNEKEQELPKTGSVIQRPMDNKKLKRKAQREESTDGEKLIDGTTTRREQTLSEENGSAINKPLGSPKISTIRVEDENTERETSISLSDIVNLKPENAITLPAPSDADGSYSKKKPKNVSKETKQAKKSKKNKKSSLPRKNTGYDLTSSQQQQDKKKD